MPCRRNRNRNPDERFQEVMQALREATHGTRTVPDPIAEQLKQCPEAFKVGEILGKAIDSFKYGQDEPSVDRLLPPPGAVIPPLV